MLLTGSQPNQTKFQGASNHLEETMLE